MDNYKKERQCPDCGKIDIIRKDSNAIRCGSCSAKISNKAAQAVRHQSKGKETCVGCGKTFYSPKSDHRKYCSKECFNNAIAAEKVGRICKHCGTEFKIHKSVLKTNATGNFCTRGCYEKWMCDTERTNGRGSRWKAKRKDALKETPFCSLCGASGRLEVHHIVPYRLTHDSTQSNLIPLCKKCHKTFESITHEIIAVETDYERMKFMLSNILNTYKQKRLTKGASA